jgi:GT2 family glycosyltransferase
MAKVVAVVLNWKRWHDTLRCVASLRAQSVSLQAIVVVDNGSDDDSERRLREAAPDVVLLQTGRNLGFGGGSNVGIRYALERGADFVLLINNDAIMSVGTLAEMIGLAQSRQDMAAVGAVLYDADGRGGVQCWGGGRASRWVGVSRKAKVAGHLDYLTAACVLLRPAALQQVGLFDEKTFFMYWEDVDLSFRMRASGWAIGVAEKTQVWHQESASLGKKNPLLDRYFTVSTVRFLRRYARWPALAVFLTLGLRLGKRLCMGDWRRFKAVWQGWVEA